MELVHSIMTYASVLTWTRFTLVDVDMTVFTSEAGRTCALEIQSVLISTGSPIRTGKPTAQINAILAQLSRESGRTVAVIVANTVPAGASIQASDSNTIVQIHFTVFA